MPPAAVDVREIRRRLRLSQRAFAAKFGFSPRTVQEWEQGRAQPDRPARLLLAMIARAPKTVELQRFAAALEHVPLIWKHRRHPRESAS